MRKRQQSSLHITTSSPVTGIYSVGETHSDSRSLQAVTKHTDGPQMLPDTGLPRGGWDTCQNEKPKEDVIVSFLKRGIKE